MKIIHISDLHLCQLYKKSNIVKINNLINYIARLDPGHLVITGDISDNASEKDYLILKKILQAFNLYSAEKTTIIPGNHDIYGGVQRVEDILNFPSRCLKVDYNEKVNIFVEYFRDLYSNTYFPDEAGYFPFAKPLDSVLLIGINTVDKYSKFKNPMASNGKVHKKQMEGLYEILQAKSFCGFRKIVMAHHHFYKGCHEVNSSENAVWNKIEKYTMKLRGKRKLINAFSVSEVDLVLHGHSHDMKIYERKGITFVNAGNTMESHSLNLSQMYLLDIPANGEKATITLHKVKREPEKKRMPHLHKTI